MNATKKTLIEEGTEVKGTLSSTSAIVVMGRVEGELTGPSVEVTGTGVVSGKAKVTELRSRGELSGEFDADLVELSGKVRDKTLIRAKSLEVSLQRTEGKVEVVFGECELAIGEAPDKAKAIREATSGAGRPGAAAAAAQPAASLDADGGEVTSEADASASGKVVRRPKRPGEGERQPESA
jgi:cytoskeletal protein CcmA (bactofilin family)